MNFNFNEVEVAEVSVSKFVEPGFQKLTITGLAETTAKTGSTGYELEFESDKGGTFKQKFWIADASGNMSKAAASFQYLVSKFTGNPLKGEVNTASLSALLVGKSAEATVGGRRYTSEKDGVKYNRVAAELPFAGWEGEGEIRYSGQFDDSSTSAGPDLGSPEDGANDLPF